MRVESLQSRAISVLIVILLTVAPCLAQNNASLEVIVKDPTGALISKAQVQLIKTESLNRLTQPINEAKLASISWPLVVIRFTSKPQVSKRSILKTWIS